MGSSIARLRRLQKRFGRSVIDALTLIFSPPSATKRAGGSRLSAARVTAESCRSIHGGADGTASNLCVAVPLLRQRSQRWCTGATKENLAEENQPVVGSVTITEATDAKGVRGDMHDGSGLFTEDYGPVLGQLLDRDEVALPRHLQVGSATTEVVSVFMTGTHCKACGEQRIRPVVCGPRDAYWECSSCESTHWIPLSIN